MGEQSKQVKPSKAWLKMAELYRRFARPWEHICDFSDKAALEMYLFESTGKGQISPENGFAAGKHWMDARIKEWRRDIAKRYTFKYELYDSYPKWFLDKIGVDFWYVSNKPDKELLFGEP